MKRIDNKAESANRAFELAVTGSLKQKYVLRLYIAGSTPQSNRAVANIKVICEEPLKSDGVFVRKKIKLKPIRINEKKIEKDHCSTVY